MPVEARKFTPRPTIEQVIKIQHITRIHLGTVQFSESQQTELVRHGLEIGIWQIQNYDDLYRLLTDERRKMVAEMGDIKIKIGNYPRLPIIPTRRF